MTSGCDAPAPFRSVAIREPAEVVSLDLVAEVGVIGDNAHDLTMGRAAGAGLLVGVLTGTGEERDLAPHAHEVLPSIADLPALLQVTA